VVDVGLFCGNCRSLLYVSLDTGGWNATAHTLLQVCIYVSV